MAGSLVMTVYSDGAPKTRAPRSGISARYDNALTHDENRRNWWGADYLSAKSANSFQVRRQLRNRSRYELSNNPYLYGVCTNNADDLIDTGPTLQLKTPSAAYNRQVEEAWADWCACVGFVEKLRTQKLAKSVDGEGFLVLKTVSDLEHPVKLYPVDLEADQVTSPAPRNLIEFWVDGLTLHPVTGRPTAYHVLRHHPGDYFFPGLNPLEVDRISARYVLHWFVKFRPGQVRGVPVFTPSLDLFTELRAFRRAVLSGAELAADFAAVLEQDPVVGANPDLDTDAELEAFKRVPIDRRMMTTLPPGAKMSQFRPEQPQTTYEMFQEKCLGEACRPLAYPLNLALGTSQKFNFSSAKLDHINYRSALRVERTDCERVVLGPLFRAWYAEAVLAGVVPVFDGADIDRVPPCEWHWPGFEPLDPMIDAQADQLRIAGGQDTLAAFWARRGYDWRAVLGQLSDERKELERLGLQFGEPATKSITQNEDEDGNPKAPKKAEAGRRQPVRAVKDANGAEHDDADGRFTDGGGSGSGGGAGEHRRRWEAEDRETDRRRGVVHA